jgi:two-component system chemotaxis response regulator CheB
VAATEYIMAYVPTPILIVSASTNRGELFKTYDALAAGAVDVLEKPPADDVDGAWERRFVATVKLIARIKVITHLRARLAGTERGVLLTHDTVTTSTHVRRPNEPCRYSVLVFGASTGGPAAIVRVLQSLPRGLKVPVLFVLHIGEPFGVAFAEWLGQQTSHRVMYARESDAIDSLRGQVIMAPPGRHLVVQRGRLHLNNDPPRHSCRPSVDVLFESVAADRGASTLACLLTGMGRDGAAGLLAIRRAGGFTIAQDESTSIVYGMPREAVILGAAQKVLPLDQIGPEIVQCLAGPEIRTPPESRP